MISIKDLGKDYDLKKGKLRALRNFNLEVKRGEIVAVLGPNGAGKSTLMKVLSTLIYPTAGDAWINKHSVRTDAAKIRKLIGVVLGPNMIYHRLTGRSNLKFYGAVYNVPHLRKRIDELVSLVGLEDKIDQLVESYSAGMKSKLALIRGMIHNPPVLLLDEPTVGLDPNISLKIRKEIVKLRDEGKTILMSTHYMVEAEQIADRIAILNKGKLISLDTPAGIRRRIPSRRYLEVSFRSRINNVAELQHAGFIVPHDKHSAMLPVARRKTINELLEKVVHMNIPISNVKIVEPSLEEAFSFLTKNGKHDVPQS